MKNDAMKKAIQRLYDKDGEVKASTLVATAKPKNSPIHNYFEWDDKIAGHEYRLIQGRKYIRIVTIERENKPEQLVHVGAANPETGSREGVYKTAPDIVKCPDEFERAISEAITRLSAARRAVDLLERVARAKPDGDERSAMIAQIASAIGKLETALDRAVH